MQILMPDFTYVHKTQEHNLNMMFVYRVGWGGGGYYN